MFKQLLLPPVLLIIALGLVALLPQRRLRLVAAAVIGFSLYLVTTPFGANALLRSLEVSPAIPLAETADFAAEQGAQAIVVLSAGVNEIAPELGGSAVDHNTLIRLRYAAILHRQTGLPILVTGGPGVGLPVAQRMAISLRRDFSVPTQWIEPRARNTFENARFTAEILREQGIERVLLVSHGWHLRRGAAAFRDQGLIPIPAGTAWAGRLENTTPRHFLPTLSSITGAYYGFHEWVGLAYYHIRYFGRGAPQPTHVVGPPS